MVRACGWRAQSCTKSNNLDLVFGKLRVEIKKKMKNMKVVGSSRAGLKHSNQRDRVTRATCQCARDEVPCKQCGGGAAGPKIIMFYCTAHIKI